MIERQLINSEFYFWFVTEILGYDLSVDFSPVVITITSVI